MGAARKNRRINIYSYPPHASGPITLIRCFFFFKFSPLCICGFCKHRLKAVTNSKDHYGFNRLSPRFNRQLFIKQQHFRFEMTCTVIEFQASATSSNFQEILGSGFASGKVFTLPFEWAPFCFFVCAGLCARISWIMDFRCHESDCWQYRLMAFSAVFWEVRKTRGCFVSPIGLSLLYLCSSS